MQTMGQPESGQPDPQRFELLFEAHGRAVLGYALRRVDDPADASDVLAETFLVAWRRLDAVPVGDDTRPWLLGVARRALANQRRGARRRADLTERLRAEIANALTPAEPSDHEILVERALSALRADDREVLLLAAWEGLTPGEIATALGIRAVAARSRLHRARRRLQAELDRLGRAPVGNERSPTFDLVKEHSR
jgi:RNA polymerase sigma-70 factor, ECF subfamily